MSSRFIARDVACAGATGRMYDYGAQVTAWTPRSERPVIWTPKSLTLTDGEPIRGGVPVCFPWFGTGAQGDLTPQHGPARTSRWLLVDSFLDEAAGTHQLTYRLTPKRMGLGEPGSFETVLQVTFGRILDMRLTVTNTGTAPFTYEAALHTYIAVGDVNRVSLLGLDEAGYLDRVKDQRDTQHLDVTFTGATIDRMYQSTGPVTIEDPNNARRIVVRKENSATTVVWNPGIDGARAAADLDKDDWKNFVCVEAANCRDDAVTLAPEQSHTLSQTLSVEHL